MTDQTRNLLIRLASHMAYMQGQLEAHHQFDDPEDYYWYRESVALRQKVTDALADGPAVPEGREPASVVGEPSNRMPTLNVIMQLADNYFTFRGNSHGGYFFATSIEANKDPAQSIYEFARAVLARWGTSNQAEIRSSLGAATAPSPVPVLPDDALIIEPAEHTLLVPVAQPVPVSERLPGPEDCDAEGRCWWGEPQIGDSHDATWNLCTQDEAEDYCTWGTKCGWLPFTALPLPAFWDGDCDKTSTPANR